jgi:hypothetical protein
MDSDVCNVGFRIKLNVHKYYAGMCALNMYRPHKLFANGPFYMLHRNAAAYVTKNVTYLLLQYVQYAKRYRMNLRYIPEDAFVGFSLYYAIRTTCTHIVDYRHGQHCRNVTVFNHSGVTHNI